MPDQPGGPQTLAKAASHWLEATGQESLEGSPQRSSYNPVIRLEMQAQCRDRRAQGQEMIMRGRGQPMCWRSLQGKKEGTRRPSKSLPAHGTIPHGLEFETKFELEPNMG